MNLFAHGCFRDVAIHLWQATLFGLVITLVLLLLPGPARLRHFAGCLALLRFLLPAGLLVRLVGFMPWVSTGGLLRATGLGSLWMPAFVISGSAARMPAAGLGMSLPVIAMIVWCAGTVLLFGIGLIRLARGLRALRRRQAPFSTAAQARLDTLAVRVGIAPGLVTGCFVPPSGWLGVIGIFRSRIVVPEGLFSALDEKEVESVLLHELVHVKRHDNLLRLFQAGVVALFWFHPLVWWLDRRLRWESESACDEAVLRLTGANHVYATGLFKAVRYALELDLPGVSGMSRIGLQSRLRAVLNHQDRKDSPVKLALTVSTLVGFFGIATLMASTPAAPGGTALSADQKQVAEGSGSPVKTASTDSTAADQPGGKILDISELDQIPVVRKQACPVYPYALRKQGAQATVVVGFVLNEQGTIGDVAVVRSTNHGFDQACMDAVQQWEFKPGLKDGKPVNVRMSVPVVFALTDEKPAK
jgi:TonB family protein